MQALQRNSERTRGPTVSGEKFFSLSYFQMREFFIHSRIVQAAYSERAREVWSTRLKGPREEI